MSSMISYAPRFAASRTCGMRWLARNSRPVLNAIRTWRLRIRQRSELLMLNAVELRELSLSEADVNREGSKPFWASILLNDARG
jgi:uncharacterized protein YjiS (DUF1127 family)